MKKLITLCFLAIGIMARAQTAGYQVGDAVADFSLKNVDNKMVSMSDFKESTGYIVVFTCNTCPVAKAYESRIIDLNQKYEGKGYPVIAINSNDPLSQPGDAFEKMQERAKSKQYDFPYLNDTDQSVAKKFGAARTPHIYVIMKTAAGNVVQYIGAIDNDTENNNPEKTKYVENAVNALISGKKPEITFTKAVGCSIKWKKEKA